MVRWQTASMIAGGFLAAATAGCLIDLDAKVSCGDGVIDRSVGEECEPGMDTELWQPSDCEPQGTPKYAETDCEPTTCTIRESKREQVCAVCGDGKIEGNEQCDFESDNTPFFSEVCTEPDGVFKCRPPTSLGACTIDRASCHCGDGIFQENLEECEWYYPCGDQARPDFTCASVGGDCHPEELRCVASPFVFGGPTKACTSFDPSEWGSGDLRPLQHCQEDCTWDTEDACSRCGNGRVDTGDNEQCDGPLEDPTAKRAACASACAGGAISTELDCDLNCRPARDPDGECTFEQPDPNTVFEEIGCCVIREAPCISGGGGLPCCEGLTCKTVAVGTQLETRCVP